MQYHFLIIVQSTCEYIERWWVISTLSLFISLILILPVGFLVIPACSSRMIHDSLLWALEGLQFLIDLIIGHLCWYGPIIRKIVHQFRPILLSLYIDFFKFVKSIFYSQMCNKWSHQLWWSVALLWHLLSKLLSTPMFILFWGHLVLE